MKIHLDQIPVEGLVLEGEEAGAVLAVADGQAQFATPLHYELMATLAGASLVVRGRLWTATTLECSCCLKKFSQPLVVEHFLYASEIAGQDVFDLTESLREDILLQLPQRAVCTPTCKGLCPRCGQNLNVKRCQCPLPSSSDRWVALSKLKL